MIRLSNGSQMPQVGFGTYQLKGEECVEAVVEALRCGYRLIDTAAVYQNEAEVAKAIQRSGIPRSEIFITSKLQPSDQKGFAAVEAALEKTLKNLGTDYLDLYLIHWPGSSGLKLDDPTLPALRKESWSAFESFYKSGRCRNIGVSNFQVRHLQELMDGCTTRPHVNQIELHPKCRQRAIVSFCKQHGIHLTAYSSLGRGNLMTCPAVTDVAQEVGRLPNQVLLRWAIEHGYSVLPKTARIERVASNFAVLDFTLTPAVMQRLDNLLHSNLCTDAGHAIDDCDEHTCWNSRDVL